MSDHHDHAGHPHGHSHGPANYNFAFAVGIALNFGFVLVEGIYGYLSHSLALMADAGHNLSDVLGLALAWGAIWLSNKKPSKHYTYGFRSTSILAALANALLLLVAIGGIAWEAIGRLSHPEPVAGGTVIVVAGIGIVINSATALLFMSGRKGDINIRGAYLHMAADAAVSLGVVIAGFLILKTGWIWLDPAISLAISLVILFGTWRLLKDSLHLITLGVPEGIELEKLKTFLETQPGVSSVHDLHVWPMSTTENALTAHLHMPSGHPGDEFLKNLSKQLDHDFKIHHSTVQIETAKDASGCHLEPDNVV
ncbi:MAG: cation diffusion facilitator family transporter [Bacteriovoracia bacterium]